MKNFEPQDVIRDLLPQHRDAMLNVILAWAELEGALKMLLSRVLGLEMHEGARLIGRSSLSGLYHKIAERLGEMGHGAAAKIIMKQKRACERQVRPRNLIAHSKCVGHWLRDSDYVVFTTFEAVGAEQLAIDRVPIQVFERWRRWAIAMTTFTMKIVDGGERSD